MAEFPYLEAFLDKDERISLMKKKLQKVIDLVLKAGAPNRRNNIRVALNDLFAYVESIKYKLELSQQQKDILDILQNRKDASYEQIAYWCAQLLGMFEIEPDEPVTNKDEFLNKLQSLLEVAGKNGATSFLLEITKLINSVDRDNNDEDIKKIISDIEESLIDIFVYGMEVSTVQLEIYKWVVVTMRKNLPRDPR